MSSPVKGSSGQNVSGGPASTTSTPVGTQSSLGSSSATPATGAAGPSGTLASSTSAKIGPKDGQVITAILKDVGVTEYEPRVVHQLLEFAYRYVTTVLEDAHLYSTYAKKKSLDMDDVKLAVQMLSDKMFTSPPPRDLLMEIARHKNNIPLPPIKSHAGPRLPPDRYSLISCNFKMKSAAKIHTTYRTTQITAGTSLLPSKTSNITPLVLPPRTPTTPGPSGTRVIITPIDSSNTNNGVAATGIKRKIDNE